MQKTLLAYRCRAFVRTVGILSTFCLPAAGQAPHANAQGSGQGGAGSLLRQPARRPPPHPMFSSQPVTLHVNGKFEAALTALFTQAPVNYIYALPAAPTNTALVDIKQTPFDDAFNAVLRAFPAAPALRPHLVGSVLSLMQSDPPGQKTDLRTRRVTLRFKNVPLRDAFNALFAALEAEHTPMDKIEGQVTLSMRDAPHEAVLQALMKQSAHPLTLLERGSTLIIQPK